MKMKFILITLFLPALSFASTQMSLSTGNYKCKKVLRETEAGQVLEAESSDQLIIERFHDGEDVNFDMTSFNMPITSDCHPYMPDYNDIKISCNPAHKQISFSRTTGEGATRATSILVFIQSGSKVIVADTTHLAKSTSKDGDITTKMICDLQ